MRTQRNRKTKALVHRWYRPDSHNEWIDQSVAPEVVENDAEHLLGGPAKVFVRWVRVRTSLCIMAALHSSARHMGSISHWPRPR